MKEKIAGNFDRLSRAHQRHRRQTDGTAIAYSEVFANKNWLDGYNTEFINSRSLPAG